MSLRRERRGKAAQGSIVAVSQKTCPSSHANGAPDRVRGRSGIFRASTLGDVTTVAARSLVTATCGLGLSTPAETVASFTLAREMGAVIRSHSAAPASGGLP
jgi:hypothetical protein